jgi:hypothetical protein
VLGVDDTQEMGQKKSQPMIIKSQMEPIWWHNPHKTNEKVQCGYGIVVEFSGRSPSTPGSPMGNQYIRIHIHQSALGEEPSSSLSSVLSSSSYSIEIDTYRYQQCPTLLHFPLMITRRGDAQPRPLDLYVVVTTSLDSPDYIGHRLLIRIFTIDPAVNPLTTLTLDEEIEAGRQAHLCRLPNSSYIVTPPQDRKVDHAGVIMVSTTSLRWMIFSADTCWRRRLDAPKKKKPRSTKNTKSRSPSIDSNNTDGENHGSPEIYQYYGSALDLYNTRDVAWAVFVTRSEDRRNMIEVDCDDKEHLIHAQSSWVPTWHMDVHRFIVDHYDRFPIVLVTLILSYCGSSETCRLGEWYSISQLHRGIDVIHVDKHDQRYPLTDPFTIPLITLRIFDRYSLCIIVHNNHQMGHNGDQSIYYMDIPQNRQQRFINKDHTRRGAEPFFPSPHPRLTIPSSLIPISSHTWLPVTSKRCIQLRWSSRYFSADPSSLSRRRTIEWHNLDIDHSTSTAATHTCLIQFAECIQWDDIINVPPKKIDQRFMVVLPLPPSWHEHVKDWLPAKGPDLPLSSSALLSSSFVNNYAISISFPSVTDAHQVIRMSLLDRYYWSITPTPPDTAMACTAQQTSSMAIMILRTDTPHQFR